MTWLSYSQDCRRHIMYAPLDMRKRFNLMGNAMSEAIQAEQSTVELQGELDGAMDAMNLYELQAVTDR
jgi:hypothetical protein